MFRIQHVEKSKTESSIDVREDSEETEDHDSTAADEQPAEVESDGGTMAAMVMPASLLEAPDCDTFHILVYMYMYIVVFD